jgi:hypothetical protein
MAEPKGMVYLQPGGADLFKKHTSKIFRKRNNDNLIKLDILLAGYPTIPRDDRKRRTLALVSILSLCNQWLSSKATKLEGHSSFRAPHIRNLHEAASSALRGIEVLERVRKHFAAKKNWDTTLGAVKKIIPEGSTHGADGKPVRIMQGENWLEILDKHHRRGQELKRHFQDWQASNDPRTFWQYLEQLDPNALQALTTLEVSYIDDLMFRDLFTVNFQGGLMRSKITSDLQQRIVDAVKKPELQTADTRQAILSSAEEKLLDTSNWPSHALAGLTDGWGAFVLSPQDVLYVGVHVSGSFHHSSFLCGAPVLAAGMIKVEKGRIRGIHEKNGHYRSQEVHMQSFLKLLQRNMPGTDWHGVEYYSFGGAWMTVGQKLNLPRRPPVPSRANRGPLPSTLASPQHPPQGSGTILSSTPRLPQAQGRVRAAVNQLNKR